MSGSYSGSTRAVAGIFQESDVPYISADAIHPDITRAGDYVFRTSFVGEVQGRAGAKLVGEMLGLKRAVIVTIQNDFGQSLPAGFKGKAADFGVEIVAEYEYSIKDRQFGPIVSKIRSDNPDVIYATGYFFTAGPLAAQLRAAGITVPVIGQEGYGSQSYIEIAGRPPKARSSQPRLTAIPTPRRPRISSRHLKPSPATRWIWSRPLPTPLLWFCPKR